MGALLGAKDGALVLSSGAGSISGSISGGLFLVVYFWSISGFYFWRCRSDLDGRKIKVEKGRGNEDRKGGSSGGPGKGPRETGQNRVCVTNGGLACGREKEAC